MIRYSPRKAAFLLILAFPILAACTTSGAKPPSPRASQGVLDLRAWSFEHDGPVRLDGEWEFYWKRFLNPSDFLRGFPERTGFLRQPSSWSGFLVEGGEIGYEGYATFRLKVLLPKSEKPLSIRIMNIASAYRLYGNGKLLQLSGTTGTTAEEESAKLSVQLATPFPAEDTLDLVLQVSNFDSRYAGLHDSLELGLEREIGRRQLDYWILAAFFLSALFLISVYHGLLFFLRRKERSNLYFAVFSLLWFINSLVEESSWRLVNVFSQTPISWSVLNRLDQATIYLAFPFMLLFYRELFPAESPRRIIGFFLAAGTICSVAVWLLPMPYVELLTTCYMSLVIFFIFVALRTLILAVRARRIGARIILAGSVVTAAAGLSDTLNFLFNLYSYFFTPMGLFFLILSQSTAISRRFADAYTKVEGLSEELAAKNVELSRLDRVKDEFVANTSHELKTPLTGILGLAESLLAGPKAALSEEARNALALIAGSAKRLGRLVNDILDFSKMRNSDLRLRLGSVDLKASADLVFALQKPLLAGRNLRFVNSIPPDFPQAEADENRLLQIFHNLVGNAVKFTDSGEIEVSARREDGRITVAVRDTGIGIPKEKRESVFRAFEQLDASLTRQYGGTGLGLAITKALVELHGGRLWVESEPGRGSVFFFTLKEASGGVAGPAKESPRRDEAGEVARAGTENAAPTLGAGSASGEPRIEEDLPDFPPGTVVLAVDDEPSNLEVFSAILGLRGITVFRAAGGREALEILDGPAKPKLVLLDLMMPKMNGLEVCARIRKKYSANSLPVLIVTANDQPATLLASVEAGANDYIEKPFTAAELLARVKLHLDLARLQEGERFAVVGRMAAEIAHDLSSPIQAIRVVAMIAREEDFSPEKQAVYLDRIEREIGRLSELARDILDYIRGDVSLDLKTAEPAAFLEETLAPLRDRFRERSVDLRLEAEASGRVLLDAGKFRRVVLNLAENALACFPRNPEDSGGKSRTFVVKAGTLDGRAVFSFRDSGPGVAGQIRTRLFEPFVTFGKKNGTGLGLAIAKKIVEQHGGRIGFEDAPGGGTIFRIELPFADEK